jgi:hypothetical protein
VEAILLTGIGLFPASVANAFSKSAVMPAMLSLAE